MTLKARKELSMRIRSTVCSLVLLMGLAGSAFTATSTAAAKQLTPCPKHWYEAYRSQYPIEVWIGLRQYDVNGNGVICRSTTHGIMDDTIV